MRHPILMCALFLFISTQPMEAGWQYRRAITISPSDTYLTDYQIRVLLTPTNFNYDHSFGEDGRDLRFSTDSAGTSAPDVHYWIEEWNAGDTSKIWVKVPEISEAGEIIYMFYGNPFSALVSNGDSTFIFFDDFEDGIIDTHWTEVEYIGTILETSGYLETDECGQSGGQYCVDGYAYIYQPLSDLFPGWDGMTPFRIRVVTWNQEESTSGEQVATSLWTTTPHNSWPPDAVFFNHFDPANGAGYYQGFDRNVHLGNYSLIDGNWYSEEFRFDGSSVVLWFNESARDTITDLDLSTAYLSFGNTASVNYNIDNNRWDNLIIGNYTDLEPSLNVALMEDSGNWYLNPDLIAYWTFDEMAGDTLFDISGEGHHGVISFADWAEGFNGGGALSFDGVSSQVTVPADSAFSGMGELTVEAILNVGSFPSVGEYSRVVAVYDVFNGSNSATQQAFALGLTGTPDGPYLSFVVRTGSNTSYDGTGVSGYLDGEIQIGQWAHVAAICDSGYYYLYINGEPFSQNLIYTDAFIKDADTPLTIGYSIGTNNENPNLNTHYTGLIDEIRLSRAVLTPDQFLDFTPLESGLVAYYPFNGNANDESGNGIHGDTTGHSPTITYDRFGHDSSSYDFDGLDDHVSVPENDLLWGSELSVSAWVNFDNYDDTYCILESWSGMQSGVNMFYAVGDNTIVYQIMIDEVVYEIGVNAGIADLGQWHLFTQTYDGNYQRAYIDGIEVGNNQIVGGFVPPDSDLLIGSEPTYFNRFLDGKIDDVRIYSRALTEAEIENLFHEGGWLQQEIVLSLPELTAMAGNTVLVPVNVEFPAGQNYSSAELTFSGYQTGLNFVGIDTGNSLMGDAGWDIYVNETDSLLVTASGGSNDISGAGTLFRLQFLVPDTSSPGFIPVIIEHALFDETDIPVAIINGGVTVVDQISYGDVSLNGEVHAYDGSLILKYLVGSLALDEQQLLNANVSQDTTVSALDAALIFQYVVGLIDTLPYDTTMGTLMAAGELGMVDGQIEAGQAVAVPLYLSGGDNILAFTGTIQFDPEHLVYDEIEWSELLGDFSLEINEANGAVRFAGADPLPDGQDGIFATIHFSVNPDFSADSTTIRLSDLRWNEENIMENVASATLTRNLAVDGSDGLPSEFSLGQNYPNPFNPSTTLQYGVPVHSSVQLTIYNLKGETVRKLVDGAFQPGYYRSVWDGRNDTGLAVSSGIYIYRFTGLNFTSSKKMILFR